MRSRTACLKRLAILPVLICVSVAAAQQPERSQRREATRGNATTAEVAEAQRTTPAHKLIAFKLQHHTADSVVALLENLQPTVLKSNDLRLAADSRTNSILALGTDDALQKIEAMIRELDVAEQDPRPDAAAEVRIFTLEKVGAREAAETLRSLYADLTDRNASAFGSRQRAGGSGARRMAIAADERTNSVIVSGDKGLLLEVEALLLRLDQEHPREDNRQTQVIGLQGVPADEAVDTLRKLGPSRLEVTAEGTANQLILRGSKDSVQQATDLLRTIYEHRRQTADDVRLRVVWLVSPGLAVADAAEPPQNLEKVLNALKSKAGVGDLKMAAQFLLNASSRSGDRSQQLFSAAGTSVVQSGSADVQIEGKFEASDGPHPRLQIQIEATQTSGGTSSRGASQSRQLCQLQTTISAPPGHPVVLGMTPIDSMESVFVIEILPADEPDGTDTAEPEPASGTRQGR